VRAPLYNFEMWRKAVLTIALLSVGALACEAVTHANDYGTASSGVAECGNGGTIFCGGQCIAQDAKNCGGCGVPCEATQVCSNGVCGSQCSGGTTQCGDLCVDTQNDPANCGRCGGTPDAGPCPFCQDGVCQSVCPAPSLVCGTECVDVTSDPKNCKTCGHKCGNDSPVCNNGKCDIGCGTETLCPTGGCADVENDPNNCNGCGNKCPGPLDLSTGVAACVAHTCYVACKEGLTYCVDQVQGHTIDTCVDLTSNVLNCGECGNSCLKAGTSASCSNGKCNGLP